jgi:hypothetical protein
LNINIFSFQSDKLPLEIFFCVGKNDTSYFFLLCFKFFSHGNSVGIYRGNISVGKIPRKFTDENIPSVFPFVFINFLVVVDGIVFTVSYDSLYHEFANEMKSEFEMSMIGELNFFLSIQVKQYNNAIFISRSKYA